LPAGARGAILTATRQEADMLALLLAGAVAAAQPPARPPGSHTLWSGSHGLTLQPSRCRAPGVQAARAGPAEFRKLGDLPKARLEIAIERSIEGCPAPVIVRYDVEEDGSFAGRPGK
jgi:hypothetical protein